MDRLNVKTSAASQSNEMMYTSEDSEGMHVITVWIVLRGTNIAVFKLFPLRPFSLGMQELEVVGLGCTLQINRVDKESHITNAGFCSASHV